MLIVPWRGHCTVSCDRILRLWHKDVGTDVEASRICTSTVYLNSRRRVC